MIKVVLKKIKFVAEFLALILMIGVFKLIGFKASSYISGVIVRLIGKRHRSHRTAYGNMVRAIPEIKEGERVQILDKMWMSLGRIIGEYVHICRMKKAKFDKMVEVDEESLKNIQRMKERSNDKNAPKGGIIFSGHIGNWEVGLRYLMLNGVKMNALYRPFNNGYVNKVMVSLRDFEPIPKGLNGLRDVISHIKKGEYVVILADQRVADGEFVKFFHEDALTTTSIARLALKYGVEIVPARSSRIGDSSTFKMEVDAPLEIEKSGDLDKDVTSFTVKINEKLEKWIRQMPEQWFWVHNRWK